VPQTTLNPAWRCDVPSTLAALSEDYGTTLAFGNGRSYGDSCLAASGRVMGMRGLDRFISVDWVNGIVIAEAGVTLEQVLDLSIPNGWFLAVTPGTKFVTLGGAIANDVHGKNHHVRGTFGRHVRRFGLSRSDCAQQECAPEKNGELFNATIGGLGLTGIITWVELQLMPIASSEIDTFAVRFKNIFEFFQLSRTLDHQHEYSVAWVDCLAQGEQLGRGVFFVGDHSRYGQLTNNRRARLEVPFTPPVPVINTLSLHAFNAAYWRLHPKELKYQKAAYNPFFYPLDRIGHWNRLYGPQGFQQYQCVIPDNAAENALPELLREIALSGEGSFLAVLKRCGDIRSPGLLSFPMPGVSLALDFPHHRKLDALFQKLDSIVSRTGGRLYPAKDAHMAGQDFRAAYPAWEQLEALRDPALMSSFWKRVTT
jgi:FAD/FMN-containing dehydrogenase